MTKQSTSNQGLDNPKQGLDNHANQLNPTHPAYHRARGASPEEAERLASEAQAGRAPDPQTGVAKR